MNVGTLEIMIEAIRAGLMKRADPAKAPNMQRYMKSSMPFYGVQKPERVRLAREFFIRKAIGWALRSYAWVAPDAVVAYCDTHELSPLSRREALKNIRA